MLIKYHIGDTKRPKTHKAKGRMQRDVEVIGRIITQREQDLERRVRMAHRHRDGERALAVWGYGDLGALGRLREAAAREGVHVVFVFAAWGWIVETEVGGDEGD